MPFRTDVDVINVQYIIPNISAKRRGTRLIIIHNVNVFIYIIDRRATPSYNSSISFIVVSLLINQPIISIK